MPLQLTTILARSSSVFEHHIRGVVDKYAHHQNLVCVFALTSTETLDWARYWQLLRSINESQTVGCLSSPFTGVRNTVKGDLSRFYGCSIGVFEPSEAVCFRSTIPGDRQAQVGRWHSFRKGEEVDAPWPLSEGVSWEDVWSRRSGAGGLSALDLGDTRPEDVHSLVYFTDRAFQGLSRTLTDSYPSASKLGLIATPTLTITELPATLLHQNNMYSTGAVGLALKKPYKQHTEFQNLQSISAPMTVGSAQGNIIHALNGDSNPTQLLLGILETTPGTTVSNPAPYRFLHERIYIGQVGEDGTPLRMSHLTSGDPSRGGLSLSSDVAPPIGSKVQFFIQTSGGAHAYLGGRGEDQRGFTFNFVTVPELVSSGQLRSMDGKHSIVLEDSFLAATDVGIVAHRPEEQDECVGLDCPLGTTVSLTSQ